jgi:hypothetical protein
MRRRQRAVNLSSDNNTNAGSCFDPGDEYSDPNTNPTDIDTDIKLDNADISWLVKQDNFYPLEYYIN